MLEFRDVSFSYGEKEIFRDFSFFAEEGISTAVLGPSGFGKTTLLALAAGLKKPQKGSITGFSGGKSSFVFQEDRLLPWCSALGNLKAVNIPEEKAREYLGKVGLSDSAEKLPEELSGGMCRRLAIARALAFGGDTFFFDEPLRGLDLKTAEDIIRLIREETEGKTVFMITHSPREAFLLSERIVFGGGGPFEIKADRKKSDFPDEEALSDFIKNLL